MLRVLETNNFLFSYSRLPMTTRNKF